MSPLRQMYRDVESWSRDELMSSISFTTRRITDSMKEKGVSKPLSMFAGYIFTIVCADKKLTEEEFLVVKPLIDALHGTNCTFAEAKSYLLKGDSYNDRDLRKQVADYVKQMYIEDQKYALDLIALAVYVSALDGDISRRERAFIESLFEN